MRQPWQDNKVSFSSKLALKSMENEIIENTPAGMTKAFKKILSEQDMDINETEMLRWCQFQFTRRYKNGHLRPETITSGTLITNLKTYMQNWYFTHMKWLRSSQ